MKQLQYDIENNLYKILIKTINEVLGKEKTNMLSTGIFLKLPIIVSFSKNKNKNTSLKNEKYLLESLSAYTILNNNAEVHFTFFYKDKTDLRKIAKEIEKNKYNYAFIYLHELQHILRKHISDAYMNMMSRICDDKTKINMAMDYAINLSLKELMDVAEKNVDKLLELSLYDLKYANMTEPSILKLLKDKQTTKEESQINDSFKSTEIKDKESGKTIAKKIEPTEQQLSKQTKEDGSINEQNVDKGKIDISDIAENLNSMISEALKGSEQCEILQKAFNAVKVNTKWFSKLQKQFKYSVYYATNEFHASWNNLNNKYRHLFKSPKKKFLDFKIEMFLSIDQSGSMSERDLGKLLYIIETESKHISKLTVLIHDIKIVKVFELENLSDISKNNSFKKALSVRYAAGGTSHKDVFKYLSDNIKDTSKTIYMCFSDMYSDIEEGISMYPIIKKITNYWINTSDFQSNFPGTEIKI